MKVYLAASYKRRDELRVYAKVLRSFGYSVTSRWLRELSPPKIELDDVSAKFLRQHAEQDIEDINEAEVFVLFTRDKKERGGMYVEMGYALAKNKNVILVGPKRNIFHWLPEIQTFDTFEGFLGSVTNV